MARSLAHSAGFGLYAPDGAQVGFARVITDCATFAYLCDVYVLEAHRGRGLGVWLVESVLADPGLQGIRRIALATRDAHGLYEKSGFARRVANAWAVHGQDHPRTSTRRRIESPDAHGNGGPAHLSQLHRR